MFILLKNNTVHETKAVSFDHAQQIASYKAEHDNDLRQIDVSNIEGIQLIRPEIVRHDPDLKIG
jgi:hypothetical protein